MILVLVNTKTCFIVLTSLTIQCDIFLRFLNGFISDANKNKYFSFHADKIVFLKHGIKKQILIIKILKSWKRRSK